MSAIKSRVTAGESSSSVKAASPAMKPAPSAASVEASASPAVPSSMLSKRRLRQPTERKHRRDANNDSN